MRQDKPSQPAPGAWRRPDMALAAGLAISAGTWVAARMALDDGGYAVAVQAPDDARSVWSGWLASTLALPSSPNSAMRFLKTL